MNPRILSTALSAVVLSLAASAASAQVPQIVSVGTECTPHGCRKWSASGTAINVGRTRPGAFAFLTARHNLRGAESVYIVIRGNRHPARVLKQHASADLAVVETELTGDRTVYRLAATPLEPGDSAWWVGYPEGGPYRTVTTRVLSGGRTVVATGGCRRGESGGPLFKPGTHDLCGVISATDGSHCYFVGLDVIRPFLKSVLSRVDGDDSQAGPGHAPPESNATSVPNDAKSDDPNQTPITAELSADLKTLRADVNVLSQQLVVLQSRRPERGPAGPRGPVGPAGPGGSRGPQGPAGKPDAAATDAMRKRLDELERRLAGLDERGVTVQILDERGRVVDETTYPPGGPIRLQAVVRKRK